MEFVYSDHAKENMLKRKIPRKVVEEAIIFPDQVIPSKKGRKIAQKVVGNRLLRIIYKEAEKIYIIVTVYFSKVGRD